LELFEALVGVGSIARDGLMPCLIQINGYNIEILVDLHPFYSEEAFSLFVVLDRLVVEVGDYRINCNRSVSIVDNGQVFVVGPEDGQTIVVALK